MIRFIWCQILLTILVIGPAYVVSISKYASLDVRERNLVTPNIRFPSDIYDNYDNYCKQCAQKKNFKGDVLGFMTTSNAKDFETSGKFAQKFNILSPDQLFFTISDENQFEIAGLENINKQWITKMKDNDVTIVPNLLFYKLSNGQVKELLNNKQKQKRFIKYLVDTCDEHQFDGFAFDMFAIFHVHNKQLALDLINKIADNFHKNDKSMYLLVWPPFWSDDMDSVEPPGAFKKFDFDQLKDSVDGFPMKFYDYSESMTLAPNAPLDWIRKNVQYFVKDDANKYKKKLLMGLNFFGMRFDRKNPRSNQVIDGTQFIDLLKSEENVQIRFNANEGEHSFDIKEHRIYYPTLYSIDLRLQLAKELGTGVYISQVGQGLDYFYELF